MIPLDSSSSTLTLLHAANLLSFTMKFLNFPSLELCKNPYGPSEYSYIMDAAPALSWIGSAMNM
jgi:hypothetical protein